MFLRPQRTLWFELYIPRHDTVRALGVLAHTGAVQLDANPKVNASLELNEVRKQLNEFGRLAAQYRAYLPKEQYRPIELPLSPQATAQLSLERLRSWTRGADALIEKIAALEQEQRNLEHLQLLFAVEETAQMDISRLSEPMTMLYAGLSECPVDAAMSKLPDGVITTSIVTSERRFVVVAALPEHAAEIRTVLSAHGCESLSIPPWLTADRVENLRRIGARITAMHNERDDLRAQFDKLAEQHGLVAALGNVGVLKWYIQHAPEVEAETHFCHVTGWTRALDAAGLAAAFRKEHIDAIIRFPEPPPFVIQPTSLNNPWWVQPFEFFTQLSGTPDKGEVDPSGLLAIIVPLLFGYMFPDVGHGLVLILTGALLARRWPQITFLIPCGIAGIAFGFVFGELFSFDNIIPALWMKPMDDPMTVMITPMIGGVLLLLLGILLSSLEAHWRGEFLKWLAMDAAVMCIYASALLMLFHPGAWRGIALGAAWYFMGGLIVEHRQPLRRLLMLAGTLLESVFLLAINTLSFARVGAFALGHVALSTALMTLLETIHNQVLFIILVVLGNLFIIAVEGLVVFVQTTRLVLFEFFIRFLRAEGRVFKPLRGPST